MLATFFDKLAGRTKAAHESSESTWFKLVKDLADGKEPNFDRVAEGLADLDRTQDDLQKAVELLLRRRELKAKVDAVPALHAERDANERKVEAANAEFEKARKKHDDIVGPLVRRNRQLADAIDDGENTARRELIRTCPYEVAIEKLKLIEADIARLQGQANAQQKLADDCNHAADSNTITVERYRRKKHSEHQINELERTIEQQRENAKAAIAERDKIHGEIEKLEATASKARLALLEP